MLNKKDFFIKGSQVSLRVLTEDDIQGNYQFWLNDPEVVKYNAHGRFPQTPDKLKDYVRSALNSNAALVLAVVDIESQKHIGNISLQSINWIDRNAEIAFLLGETEYSGKGVMLEAGQLLIRHGFEALNLHRIYCGTSAENIGMQKLAAKLGMHEEGIRRDAIFKNGKYINIIEYGLIYSNEIL